MAKTNVLSAAPLFADVPAKVLTKESDENQIKVYFQTILMSYKLDNQFPINLDEVWPLVYSRRDKAISTLKKEFIEGIDYVVFPQKVENPKGGRPSDKFMLSIPCLEYFIARKVRPVFEVYRKVFHKVTKIPAVREVVEKDRMLRDSERKVTTLTSSNSVLNSKYNAMLKLYEEEVNYKCNLIAFLHYKNLYSEWKNFYTSL